MEKLTKLRSFMFDKARYEIIDIKGNKGFLLVDYKNNKYRITGNIDNISAIEIALFAKTILDKKHGINFVTL